MREEDFVCQRLDEFDKPFVTGGRFDDCAEGWERLEEFDDRGLVVTGEFLRVMISRDWFMTQMLIDCLWRSTPTYTMG